MWWSSSWSNEQPRRDCHEGNAACRSILPAYVLCKQTNQLGKVHVVHQAYRIRFPFFNYLQMRKRLLLKSCNHIHRSCQIPANFVCEIISFLQIRNNCRNSGRSVLLYLSRRMIKLIVVIMESYHSYQLHAKCYPAIILWRVTACEQTRLLCDISVDWGSSRLKKKLQID